MFPMVSDHASGGFRSLPGGVGNTHGDSILLSSAHPHPSNLISKTNVALSSSRQPGLSQPDKGTHTISTRSKVNLLKTMVGEALAQNDTMRMLHVNGYVNLVTK